jgi:hypothetical protein
MKDEIAKRDQVTSALLGVFPSSETVDEFVSDNIGRISLKGFIDYAAAYGIIASADEEAFREFIRSNERKTEECIPPEGLTIENIFESKKNLLKINFSIRGLIQRINSLVETTGIDLPEISNTMLSRLKREMADTPRKRNTLRSLAFWLGHERFQLGAVWNYLTLLKMCHQEALAANFKEGVRMAFSLSSRGDVIGYEIVDWLRREVKNYIKEGIERFPYGNWGAVKPYDLTTLYVDFPMEKGVSNPLSYQQSIRNAVSVAHQIAIRWFLSPYCSQKRFMAIGIAAGDFATIDNYLLPVLNAKLPGDPVIRMTDFARQCVMINDIRAMFNQVPKELVLFNGESFYAWWVVGLWSLIYWDFIPQLLEEWILQDNDASIMALTRLLWFSDELTQDEIEQFQSNAVTVYLKSPHNSILGIEIAKTLYFKARYWEADEILRMVCSIYPYNLYARSIRMMIYRCLAVDSPLYSKARIHFNRAEEEASFILKNSQNLNEDFYDEYAVVKLTHALMVFRLLREHGGRFTIAEADFVKQDVYDLLGASEALFEKGLAVSPTGIRSLYLITCVRIIRRIFKRNENCFSDPDAMITLYHPEVIQPAMDTFSAMGWLREELDESAQYEILYIILEKSFKIHREAVTLKAYRPTIYYCFAVVLWDFLPLKTYKVARRVHELLSDTIIMAQHLKKENLCIYSYTRCHGEMMLPDVFIDHIQKCLEMIEECAGGMKDLQQSVDGQPLEMEEKERELLFMLNI